MDMKELYKLYTQSYQVSTDTRKITDGCIFFALKGDNFNGNQFAEEALKKGASYAVIDDASFQKDDKTILVEDVLNTLQQLASYHRKQLRIPIISLTGSNGKTTTKELINAVLSKKYKTKATVGNLNNHIGVPLTLLSMTPNTELGIVEMGANHLKEIEFLCSIAQPDYGYITNFGKAHLEGFGSLEGVVQGKTELYRYLQNNNKLVFVNASDAKQLQNSDDIKRVSFGDVIADVIVKFVNSNPYVSVLYENMIIRSQLIGSYNYNNIAAAITIGDFFGVEDHAIKEAIENYIPQNNRSQIIEKGTNKVILDAYNANPSSMQAALENLSALSDKHKVAILGDMFELGNEAEPEHQKIASMAVESSIERVYLIGKNFFKITVNNSKLQVFETYENFKEFLTKEKIENATILIKASRGMALERVLELL
ncbi:MAG: UDP-N-acetylmuramoyl-tripeptide--D-alanyl-D-alanine ligase [Flavobacteriaceae bacterium]|jgi:UDP-N-acetylmuramoyl-tripeptide--D-alanyl-D-alanine ligase